MHQSHQSLVTHREVGIDTHSWHHALKNTLRQAPDVILIGEIRDAETMEHAVAFAETGHLCMGTLHANSANQTIDRIFNFFSEERRKQLLMDLSSNLRAIVSQRLIRSVDGKGRRAAMEILINMPIIAERILKGEFHQIKAIMAKSRELGMRTFDYSLFELYNNGGIAYDEAIRNADSANELRLNIKLNGTRPVPAASVPEGALGAAQGLPRLAGRAWLLRRNPPSHPRRLLSATDRRTWDFRRQSGGPSRRSFPIDPR